MRHHKPTDKVPGLNGNFGNQEDKHDSIGLITAYDDSIDLICHEIDECGDGDQIVFSLYIWEPGQSSNKVLKALESAVKRNARVIFDVDRSYVVKFARFVEKTETFMGELAAFENKYPGNVGFSKDLKPNHKKYYLFKRRGGVSSLIFGSMNLGDRFRDWKDVLVVYRDGEIGDYVYNRFTLGMDQTQDENALVRIVGNEPARKIFQIEQVLADLFSNNSFDHYQVTTPYIDRRGLALMTRALMRHAEIKLIIPASANIYQNANMRTLAAFSRYPGVTVFFYKKMIHAKLILASGKNKQTSCLGSANLKKNSFDKLGELNGIIDDAGLNIQLMSELEAILKDCKPYEPIPYKKIMSRIEEFLG